MDRLSLTVPAGEICVLVGPSGCGKTTAMRMVNRMIEITSGDILLDGRSVNERRPAELRRLALDHAAVVEQDVAGADLDHPVDHPHGGGLAAAGGTDEHADLPGWDG